jgi:hypothetical protein
LWPPTREPESDAYSLTKATLAALEQAGMHQTWQGVSALKLAELIDAARHGASGAAANVKAHRESLQYALDNAREDAQVLDIVDRIFAE